MIAVAHCRRDQVADELIGHVAAEAPPGSSHDRTVSWLLHTGASVASRPDWGSPQGRRTEPPAPLSAEEETAFRAKAQALAPQFATELLPPPGVAG